REIIVARTGRIVLTLVELGKQRAGNTGVQLFPFAQLEYGIDHLYPHLNGQIDYSPAYLQVVYVVGKNARVATANRGNRKEISGTRSGFDVETPAGNDGIVSKGRGEPHEWMFAHVVADACLAGLVLLFPVGHRIASTRIFVGR